MLVAGEGLGQKVTKGAPPLDQSAPPGKEDGESQRRRGKETEMSPRAEALSREGEPGRAVNEPSSSEPATPSWSSIGFRAEVYFFLNSSEPRSIESKIQDGNGHKYYFCACPPKVI